MTVLIIEDEAPAYRRLIKLLKEYDNTIEIVGIIQSVKDGIEWFSNNSVPDIILSDIQLADDLSFRIFSELKLNIPVIFTTAYDEYAINAFKFYSIDYLLKPINPEDIRNSLEKYKAIHKNTLENNFEELFKKFIEKEYRERFLVYSKDSLIPVFCSEIAYFYSEDGATFLVTFDNRSFVIGDALDKLENSLNPKDFFRANRQYLLSINSIGKIHNFGLQKLKITLNPGNEKSLIISKLKAASFKKWLNK
jgi:two-component system, LytTR family, response regulator LytT